MADLTEGQLLMTAAAALGIGKKPNGALQAIQDCLPSSAAERALDD